MRLSEGNPFKICANPQAHNQNSAEQTSMRTKWVKHIGIETVQVHLLFSKGPKQGGEGGDHVHCARKPSPGHVRCRKRSDKLRREHHDQDDHLVLSGMPRFGSVRVWGWNGSSDSGFLVPAVPLQKGFSVFSTVNRKGRFRFRFLETGSGGSGSALGFGKSGSDGSGFRFWFGHPAILSLLFLQISKLGQPKMSAFFQGTQTGWCLEGCL